MTEKIAPGSAAAREWFDESKENYVQYLKDLANAGIQLRLEDVAVLQFIREFTGEEPEGGSPEKPLQ